jgi:hypothetical protein
MIVSREEALQDMWEAHNPFFDSETGEERKKPIFKEAFYRAELTEALTMREWNGHGKEDTVYEVPAGTKVMVTVYSRLGDVGIRARDIETPRYGYDARVDPHILINWEKA